MVVISKYSPFWMPSFVPALKVKSALTELKRLRERPDEDFVTLQVLRYGFMLDWIRHCTSKLKS